MLPLSPEVEEEGLEKIHCIDEIMNFIQPGDIVFYPLFPANPDQLHMHTYMYIYMLQSCISQYNNVHSTTYLLCQCRVENLIGGLICMEILYKI